MEKRAVTLLRNRVDDHSLESFAAALLNWLTAEPEESAASAAGPDARAKALLRASDAADAPTLHTFAAVMDPGSPSYITAMRVLLHDLLTGSGLDSVDEVAALTSVRGPLAASGMDAVPWHALVVAAFAWKTEYPLSRLDPQYPPDSFSPAGQLLRQSAHFIRKQVGYTATERDKLAKKLSFRPGAAGAGTRTLDELPAADPVAPLPPYYRSPIPVNYPEIARETVQIDVTDSPEGDTSGGPVVVENETASSEAPPQRMPPIRITPDMVREPTRPSSVRMPQASPPPLSSFTKAVRSKFGRSREPFTSTKLRVQIQEYPDGGPLYGVQVRVSCRGVRSYVAGTSNRSGEFRCVLPVRIRTGLTYDIDVAWPLDLGGETERKSITLNGDRTEFTVPFYRHLRSD